MTDSSARHDSTRRSSRTGVQARVASFVITAFILCAFLCGPVHGGVDLAQDARIQLSLVHQALRDEIMVISGRLSAVAGDYPIPLAKIHLQYWRSGDVEFTREVNMISSNPGGLFEDRFNATSLLRVGTWFVNASFPSQYGYLSASTVERFTIVVQPALSLHTSSDRIVLGQSVSVDGLLFACIPCLQDDITVVFIRPDNTSIHVTVRVSARGGPYPAGYYVSSFTPDVPGLWRIRAIWKGNEVTLPAFSQIEDLNVQTAGEAPEPPIIYSVVAVVLSACAFVLTAMLWRKHVKRTRNISD